MQASQLKNIINDMIKNSIRILRDEDYQRKVWFRNIGDEESCYTETIFHFLDASEVILSDQENIQQLGNKNFLFIKDLYEKIKEHFNELGDNIDLDTLTENELLDDPKWKIILNLSEKLSNKLSNFILRNEK
jgi:hypothetical protein